MLAVVIASIALIGASALRQKECDEVEPVCSTSETEGAHSPAIAADLDCDDFASWDDAQTLYEDAGEGDPHGLDRDGDGVACEALLSR